MAYKYGQPKRNTFEKINNFSRQTLGEQYTYWHNMKFNHNKQNVEQFVYALKVLGKMTGMSDKQILEHLNELFPPKTEVQVLLTEDTDVAISMAQILVALFKSKLPEAASSPMLAYMTERTDKITSKNDANKTKYIL